MDEMSVNWIKSRMRFWSVERILEIYGTYYSDHKSEGRSWKNDYGDQSFGLPCRSGAEAVSYTHLDVYKRQAPGNWMKTTFRSWS